MSTRFGAGMAPADILAEVRLEGFEAWSEAERLHVNVQTIIRSLDPSAVPPANPFADFAGMARLA